MIELSYYPGCSLSGTAKEYNESVEAVCRTLGLKLKELPDWSCCGSSSAHVTNDELAIGLAARNLEIAESIGLDVVVPCAMCYSRLKVGQKAIRDGNQMTRDQEPHNNHFEVYHLVDYLADYLAGEGVYNKVKKTLEALRPVCYYGCLITRPPKITCARNPENPQSMDTILSMLGAEVRNWSFKTDCCGGSLTLTIPEAAHRLSQKLLDMALEAGADCIAVACPMCHNNLDSGQREISKEAGRAYHIPIFYFTELMGLAFDDPSIEKWLKRHAVDPRPFLHEKDLV